MERNQVVGVHRIDDVELGERIVGAVLVEFRRRVAGEVLAPEYAVGDGAAERRQVGDGVLYPRDDVRRGVDGTDGGVFCYLAPPAYLEGVGDGGAGIRVAYGADDAGSEAGGLLDDITLLGGAGERVEAVVLDEFGVEVAVGAARAVAELIVDVVAKSLDGGGGEADVAVCEDVLGCPGAVPEAYFGDAALEEVSGDAVPGRGVAGELDVESVGAGGAAAENRNARHGVVAEVLIRERGAELRILLDTDDAVGRNELRRHGHRLGSIDVDAERSAVERGGEVRPDVGLRRAGRETERRVGRVLHFAEQVAGSIDAESEVHADYAVGVGVVPTGVVAGAADDILVGAGRRLLRTHPSLHGELLEEVIAVGAAAGVLIGERDAGFARAAEPDALAARQVDRVLRIARLLHRLAHLHVVAAPVVVRIVTFVLLEREEVGADAGERDRCAQAGIGEEVVVVEPDVGGRVHERDIRPPLIHVGADGRLVDALAGGGVSVGDGLVDVGGDHRISVDVVRLGTGRVGHPERRRIGVVRVGGGQIGGERLFVVAQAVAVGIAHSLAHHPREAHRVVCGPLGVVPADPTVAHSGDVAVGVGNHVLDVGRVVRRENAAVVVGDCRRVDVADAAENRVEAVEELVVVVHAVLVCIPEARVGADVAAGPVRRVGSDVVDGFEPGCDKEDAVEVDDGGVVRVVLNDDSGVFRTVRVEQDFTVLVRVGRVVYFSRDVAGEGRSGVVGGKNVACFIVGLLRIAPEKVEVFVLGKDRVGAGGDAGGSGAGRREHIVVMQA